MISTGALAPPFALWRTASVGTTIRLECATGPEIPGISIPAGIGESAPPRELSTT